jgi:hypothetical protein
MADIISEHLSQEFASDIKLLLKDLRKIIRVLTMYPEDNPLPTKMRGSFGGRFIEVVEEFNGFSFSIRPNEIIYNREVVYRDQDKEETLASLFYNAGIIYLEFLEGLPLEELNSFLDVLKTSINERGQDCDVVSLIWQEQFSFIKFKTVDDLALNEGETDVMIREMYPDYGTDLESQSGINYNQIILDDDDNNPETISDHAVKDGEKMGLSLESDATDEQPSLEQLLSRSFTLADEENREIAKLLEEARQFDPDRAVTRLLIEILDFWDERKPFAETIAICERIFDQLLDKGSFAVSADFIHVLRQRQEALPPEKKAYSDRLNDFIRRAGDDSRIKKLTDIINRQKLVETASIEIYLDSLGWESLVHITNMLGQLVSKEARLMICDYLGKRGRDHVNIIANSLRDKHWYVVRNTVLILGYIGGEKTLPYLSSAAGHPDHRVRREIIQALSQIELDRAIDILFGFLKDPEPKLRHTTLNHLARMGGRRAFESIKNIVHSDSFTSYPIEEQEQFLIVFSRLGGGEVTDFLGSIIGSFSLLNTGWKARYRFMALKALAYNTSEEAEQLILKFTRSRRSWLRQAAVNALDKHRKFMYQKEGEKH